MVTTSNLIIEREREGNKKSVMTHLIKLSKILLKRKEIKKKSIFSHND
jgi:hypothetical protein